MVEIPHMNGRDGLGVSPVQKLIPDRVLVPIAVVVAAAVFVLDVLLPLGVAGGVPYVALVLTGWWFSEHRAVYRLAALASVLTVAGYFLSPDGGIPWVVLTNRAYALFAIWITAIILATAIRARVRLLQNEVKLKAARIEAEAATMAKSRFLSSMSHELRTPLNAVIGFAQLMQHNPQEPLTDAQTSYTTNIVDAGEMLLGLINGVLDMAKLEAGHMKVVLDDVDVRKVLADTLRLIQPVADAAAVQLIDRTKDMPPTQVRVDPLRLTQVMINFLSNAIKYNRHQGTVALSCHVGEDAFLRIAVADTGIGIPRHLYGELFKPFERLGIEDKKTIEGTGIGLTVVKQLVEQMGGRIGFESEEAVGSTFWVDVPLAPKEVGLSWDEKFRIGILDVDDDHRMLIDLMNTLTDINLESDGVDDALAGLVNYTLHHFAREEAVMEACDYPEQESHKKAHRLLRETVNGHLERWRSRQDSAAARELQDFMRTWLVDHILTLDAQIGPYAQGKEVEIAEALEQLPWPEEITPSPAPQTR